MAAAPGIAKMFGEDYWGHLHNAQELGVNSWACEPNLSQRSAAGQALAEVIRGGPPRDMSDITLIEEGFFQPPLLRPGTIFGFSVSYLLAPNRPLIYSGEVSKIKLLGKDADPIKPFKYESYYEKTAQSTIRPWIEKAKLTHREGKRKIDIFAARFAWLGIYLPSGSLSYLYTHPMVWKKGPSRGDKLLARLRFPHYAPARIGETTIAYDRHKEDDALVLRERIDSIIVYNEPAELPAK